MTERDAATSGAAESAGRSLSGGGAAGSAYPVRVGAFVDGEPTSGWEIRSAQGHLAAIVTGTRPLAEMFVHAINAAADDALPADSETNAAEPGHAGGEREPWETWKAEQWRDNYVRWADRLQRIASRLRATRSDAPARPRITFTVEEIAVIRAMGASHHILASEYEPARGIGEPNESRAEFARRTHEMGAMFESLADRMERVTVEPIGGVAPAELEGEPTAWHGQWSHSTAPDDWLWAPQGPFATEEEAQAWCDRFSGFRTRGVPLYTLGAATALLAERLETRAFHLECVEDGVGRPYQEAQELQRAARWLRGQEGAQP